MVPFIPCPVSPRVVRDTRPTEFQRLPGQLGLDAGVGASDGHAGCQQKQEAEPCRPQYALGMVLGPGG